MKTTNLIITGAIIALTSLSSAYAADDMSTTMDHQAHHAMGESGMTMSGMMMSPMMNTMGGDHMAKMKDMMVDIHMSMLKPWLKADITDSELSTLKELLGKEASMENMMKESSQEDTDKLLSLIATDKQEAFKLMKASMKEMKKNMPSMMEKMKDCMNMMGSMKDAPMNHGSINQNSMMNGGFEGMIQKQIDMIPMTEHKTRLEQAIKRIDEKLATETNMDKVAKLKKTKEFIQNFLEKHAAHHRM